MHRLTFVENDRSHPGRGRAPGHARDPETPGAEARSRRPARETGLLRVPQPRPPHQGHPRSAAVQVQNPTHVCRCTFSVWSRQGLRWYFLDDALRVSTELVDIAGRRPAKAGDKQLARRRILVKLPVLLPSYLPWLALAFLFVKSRNTPCSERVFFFFFVGVWCCISFGCRPLSMIQLQWLVSFRVGFV